MLASVGAHETIVAVAAVGVAAGTMIVMAGHLHTLIKL